MQAQVGGIVAALLLSFVGLVYAGSDGVEAAYNNKSTSCPSGFTCYGLTNKRHNSSDETYESKGRSSTSTTYPEFFAWSRGTNIYHIGQVFEERACQVQNGTLCNTVWFALCGYAYPPAGCGPPTDPYHDLRWYVTTWHWYKRNGVEYALFTAMRNGADSAYCWNNMECL